MHDLFNKIEELRKSLAAMKPKDNQNSLVPAIKAPTLKSMSLPPTTSAAPKAPKLPGISQSSNKDPKKMAEQLKNPKPTKPKIDVMKFDKNGQWSLDKGEGDGHIGIGTHISHLKGVGTEYLKHPETGEIRAKFFNGKMVDSVPKPTGSTEPTIAPTAGTLGKEEESHYRIHANGTPITKPMPLKELIDTHGTVQHIESSPEHTVRPVKLPPVKKFGENNSV